LDVVGTLYRSESPEVTRLSASIVKVGAEVEPALAEVALFIDRRQAGKSDRSLGWASDASQQTAGRREAGAIAGDTVARESGRTE